MPTTALLWIVAQAMEAREELLMLTADGEVVREVITGTTALMMVTGKTSSFVVSLQ